LKIAKHSFHTKAIRLIFPKVAIFTLLVFIACSSSGSLRKPEEQKNIIFNLQKNIRQLLQDSLLQETRTGIKIISLETGETLYAQNSQQLFHPASNMKLLTTSTALKRLGPDFKFKTVLYADTASITDSTVSGNLYLKGFGDPDLSTDDLCWIAQKLKSKGIIHITGDLICDDTYMDDLYWGSGWMWDDVSDWYWAPICALTVDDNCVEVTVKPGKKVGESLIVQLEPPTKYMKIVNMGLTVDSLDTVQQKAFKVQRKWRPAENTIVIEGGMVVGQSDRSFVIDVVEAGLYTGTLLKEIFQKEEISLDGQVRKGIAPDTNMVLVNHLSKPLSIVVYNTNKISDNLSAELLMKTVGAEMKGPPGTAEKGISVIHQFLEEIGVDSTTYDLADGSGVSRYNVITPDLIIDLLKAMNKDFKIQAEFKTSLPIAGVDGTLQSRMKDSAAEGKLRAKTGSLRGVSALSGYTTSADNELLAFSIIMEHFVVQTSKIRKIQDRIGNLISSFSRK
jgi:D-alanyl-D-alanine carboxypeptidase/D-alanyl-D-alanine-endopeptidase (penicillin-binding protein 4)